MPAMAFRATVVKAGAIRQTATVGFLRERIHPRVGKASRGSLSAADAIST